MTIAVRKKRIGIERLLQWAFGEELPKAGREAMVSDALRRPVLKQPSWVNMGDPAVSDGRPMLNRFGVVMAATDSEPDPDAVIVGEAVRALDAFALALPEAWAADAALREGLAVKGGDLSEEEWTDAATRALERVMRTGPDGKALPRTPISRLVIGCAVSRRTPVVRGGAVSRRPVLAANGRPAWFARELREVGENADGTPRYAEVETSGLQRNGKPKPGAYQRFVVEPDPALFMVDRAEWELWRAAMDVLAEDLAGALARFDVLPCRLPDRPWLERAEEEGEAESAVLDDLTVGVIQAPKPKPLRLAGPPLTLWRTPSDMREEKKARAKLEARNAWYLRQNGISANKSVA